MKLKELVEKYGEQEVLCWAERADESLEWVNIKLEPPKPKTVWDLGKGDKCYYISLFGDVEDTGGYLSPLSEAIDMGVVFLTEEEAEKEVERRKVETLLLKFGGRRWYRTNGYNYCIWVNSWDSLVVSSTGRVQDTIYFDTEEQVQNAVNEIGEDRIKKALFEVR